MKTFLTFLGCGSSMGVPRADGYWGLCNKKNIKNYRTRSSALISKGNNNILIDTSPDLRFQLLRNKIKNISSVLYTHKHADQTHGINDLRVFFLKNKKIFPAISGGKHLIAVRFFENTGDDNYQQYQENVDFKISLC